MHDENFIEEASTTVGSHLWSSQLPGATFVLATAMIFGQPSAHAAAEERAMAARDMAISSTTSSFQATAVAEVSTEDQMFSALRQAYERVVAEQVDLGPEIKKILYANLSSLYE